MNKKAYSTTDLSARCNVQIGEKMKIVVLAGGTSTERDVSLSSGTMIYHALKKKHQAILLDVYLGYEEDDYKNVFTSTKKWAEDVNLVKEENPDLQTIKAMRKDSSNGFFGPNVISICQDADIVFLALHGENGENGKIQATFDLLGIKYTGTDYISSALAMDKVLTKELFLQHHIPTPKSDSIKIGEQVDQKKESIEYPCVVKTSCGGSSVGVYIVKTKEELEESISEASIYGSEILIEQYIKGREFSVGVVDNVALPVIEIAPLEGFYDYKNKYQAGSAIETCPAELDNETAKKMQRIAEKVFKVLRLKVYARMDFMMNNKGEIFCIEANTLPGMTPTSLLPQEAKAIGKDYEELCQWLIDLSLQK